MTTNGTSCWAIKDGVRVEGAKSGDKFIISSLNTGTWTVYVSDGSKTESTSVSVGKSARYSIGLYLSVPWSTGTDAEIAAIVAALDAGTITAAGTGWQVGDTRNVNLSSFITYKGSTPTSTATQAAQTAQLVIMNVGGKTFRGNGNSLDGQSCHFVVGFKDNVCESYWSRTENNISYSSSQIIKVENNIYNALPATIKPIFKKFDVVTGVRDSIGQTTTATTQQYFTSPAAKEVFGGTATSAGEATGYSILAEYQALSQFTWFETVANRIHSNIHQYWWERSPYYLGGSSVCRVYSDGKASDISGYNYTEGVSPYGCI